LAERVDVTSSKKINAECGYRRLKVPFDTQRLFAGVATGPEPPPPKANAAQMAGRGGGADKYRNESGDGTVMASDELSFTGHRQELAS
jgi:hypothetical protein